MLLHVHNHLLPVHHDSISRLCADKLGYEIVVLFPVDPESLDVSRIFFLRPALDRKSIPDTPSCILSRQFNQVLHVRLIIYNGAHLPEIIRRESQS